MKKNYITYGRLVTVIILVSITIAVVSTFLFSMEMKERTIESLVKRDTKQATLFVVTSLQSAMQKGLKANALNTLVDDLNSVDDNMVISVIPSVATTKMYGDTKLNQKMRNKDHYIKRALAGEEVLEMDISQNVRYVYPVKVQKEYLKYYKNMEVGDISGVVDIVYNSSDLHLEISSMLNNMILFFIVLICVIFLVIFVSLKRNVVRPTDSFLETVREIIDANNFRQRVELKTSVKEIKAIESGFNQLLDSLERQFYTDNLTGLANRRQVMEDINACEYPALAIINIDAFNQVNDFYGNSIGDQILVEIAHKIEALLPNPYFKLYRLGGDEYAILDTKSDDIEEFEVLIHNLARVLSERFYINIDQEISLSVTIGAAYNRENLVIHADMALKSAKIRNKSHLFYDDDMLIVSEYEKNLRWTKTLKQAIVADRVFPYYQPIFNNKTGRIEHYECLVRLEDSSGNVISPHYFLDVAKRSRLYPNITKAVIRKAFNMFAQHKSYRFSINLTIDDILNKDIISYVKHLLKKSPVAHNCVFELVEHDGTEHYEEVSSFINEVKALGAKIAIDDFGTGYSNFDNIMKLNVDYIKIDAMMIKNIDHEKNSEIVTETIVDFANKLGIITVAEYVHSKDVHDKVKDIGVDFSQGYLFGEPSDELTIEPNIEVAIAKSGDQNISIFKDYVKPEVSKAEEI
jgi:diguanylate cyclase (GGDEF)-like protein